MADHVGVRHAGVLEDHLAVPIEPPAALVEHLADAKARRVALDQEHGGALAERGVGIGARVDEEQLADRGVGDEAFFAVQDPFVALAFGAELQARLRRVLRRHAVVGAGGRLGDAFAEQKAMIGDERPQEALLLLGVAGRRDQVAPLPVLAEGLRDRAVTAGKFRHHQCLGDVVSAFTAVFLRHGEGAEAELRSLFDDVPVEGAARVRRLVEIKRDRLDFFVGELARRHLPVALLVAQ